MDWLGNNVKTFKVKGITIIANRNNGMVIGLDREGEEVVDEYYGAAGSSAIIRFCCFSYISILPLVTAYHNDHTSTFLSFLICC